MELPTAAADPTRTRPQGPVGGPPGSQNNPRFQRTEGGIERHDLSEPPEGWPVEPLAPGCPPDMARVEGAEGPFCIHRFEVQLSLHNRRLHSGEPPIHAQSMWMQARARAGDLPSVGINYHDAKAACADRGWHLCTSAEWEDACDGKPGLGGRPYPTEAGPTDCNTGRPGGALQRNGRSHTCRTPEGVYDLTGNLWEWTDPGLGPDHNDKRGGGFYSGEPAPCTKSAVDTHPPTFTGTVGFRCCTGVGE